MVQETLLLNIAPNIRMRRVPNSAARHFQLKRFEITAEVRHPSLDVACTNVSDFYPEYDSKEDHTLGSMQALVFANEPSATVQASSLKRRTSNGPQFYHEPQDFEQPSKWYREIVDTYDVYQGHKIPILPSTYEFSGATWNKEPITADITLRVYLIDLRDPCWRERIIHELSASYTNFMIVQDSHARMGCKQDLVYNAGTPGNPPIILANQILTHQLPESVLCTAKVKHAKGSEIRDKKGTLVTFDTYFIPY